MSDYTELCARLRRMSDMTTTNNDIRDVLRAANAIESQALEIAELRAERDHLASRYDAVVREQSEHCKDCCCARSWEALGITKYTGKSIPEHIEELRQRGGDVLAVIHGDGGHHTEAVGFDQSCTDAVARWYGLIAENNALSAKLESLQRDLAARDVTIAEMRERVKDYEDDYAAVVDEPCAPDEKHCTCVPILRRRIKELTAAEAKRFDLACAWRDTAEHIKAERDALRAKLEAAERGGRDILAQWMVERSFSTGHGDTAAGLLGELSWQVDELRAKLEAAALALENVQHGHVCPAQPGWLNAGPCTCGLDAALAAMGASAEREPVTSLASLDWPAP